MVAERPPLDQKIDGFLIRNRAIDLESKIDSFAKKKASPSIYRRGGIYDQFGPNPKAFNPTPGRFGGMIEAGANQPGSALPFVGQTAGGFAGPVGGIAVALAGEGARQGIGRMFGVQNEGDPKKQLKAAGEAALYSELFGAGINQILRGGAKAIESAKPGAIKTAIRSARNIISPIGRLAKRGERIAKTALEEGVLSSDKGKMLEKIRMKSEGLEEDLEAMIESSGESMTGERGIKRMEALARWYQKNGASDKAAKVLQIRDDIIKNQNLLEPVYGEVEKGQFVIPSGKESTQTTPYVVKKQKPQTSAEKYMQETPKTEASILEKTERKGSQELFGVTRKEREIIGQKPRQFSVKSGIAKKRGQYEILKKSKAGGGYGSETSTPEVEARQEFAAGLRKGTEKAAPGVKEINRRFGDLIELGKAVQGREGVSSRSNFLDLVDVGALTGAVLNPKLTIPIIARKLAQSGQGAMARGLYRFGKSGPIEAPQVSPVIRVLLGQGIRYANE